MLQTIIPDIDLYTDGGAEPNPGKGGYGIVLRYKGIKKEFSGGYQLTTNNRMELMAVIQGLQKIKTKSRVTVFSDSKYVINGIEKGWALKWKTKGWYRTGTEKASNYDLWDNLLNIIDEHEKVTFQWVKGHAGQPENERCDVLVMEALSGKDLEVDEGYIPRLPNSEQVLNQDSLPGQMILRDNIKVLSESDPCRKCKSSLVKKLTKKKEAKPGQNYYFVYYLYCNGCKTMYLVEDARRELNQSDNNLFT